MSIEKVSRPPFAHNWVRYNFPDVLKTQKHLIRFAEGRPPYTYKAGDPIITDIVKLGLDRETALKAARQKGHQKKSSIRC